MWAFDYLQKELNIILHRDPEIIKVGNKFLYLAHGDGLGPGDHGYKLIKRIFQNRINQWLFRLIHPDLGIRIALFWSRKSRYASEVKEAGDDEYNLKKIRERLIVHSREVLEQNPNLDWLVFGHYHLPFDEPLNDRARIVVLGDWLTHFSYAVFDGEKLEIKKVTSNG
jgi:UDP-2,3-diacylglucosamine hydrolase